MSGQDGRGPGARANVRPRSAPQSRTGIYGIVSPNDQALCLLVDTVHSSFMKRCTLVMSLDK